MRDKDDKIIYVGKAKNLKNRVNQYFVKNSTHTEKVRAMIKNIHHLEYIITNSEAEALNLECSLIKLNRPKYNILLKDDKGYPYIKITNEDFPRVVLARRQEKDGCKYFGPYISSQTVYQLINTFNKIFRLRQCKNLSYKDKPCLNYHIKRCDAPCMRLISKEEYADKVSALSDVLSGKAETLLSDMKNKMQEASDNLNFEQAAEYRDLRNALISILETQLAVSTNDENEDIVYFHKENDRICIQILYVRAGKLTDNKAFFMNNTNNETDEEIVRAFLIQYYSEFSVPKKVYVSVNLPDIDEIESFLSFRRGNKAVVLTPQRGDKLKFMEMAKKNATESMRLKYRNSNRTEEKKEAVEQLAYYLSLDKAPERIEAFDISHTSGSEVVASMVVFKNGIPSKKDYRKFKMKNSQKNDDYSAMREVVERRLCYINEKKNDKFSENPDIILVDGGKGQVSCALEVVRNSGLADIQIFGIYKDDKHKTSGITTEKEEIEIPKGTKCFTLITEIQDEMHRVAIAYHRILRARKNTDSEILKIKGVGKNRYKLLLDHFKTLNALKKASVEDISKVKGISKELAEEIHNFFKN